LRHSRLKEAKGIGALCLAGEIRDGLGMALGACAGVSERTAPRISLASKRFQQESTSIVTSIDKLSTTSDRVFVS
jgi:hypothetical protein